MKEPDYAQRAEALLEQRTDLTAADVRAIVMQASIPAEEVVMGDRSEAGQIRHHANGVRRLSWRRLCELLEQCPVRRADQDT